jgi:Putative Flp pilus-assembly TadE/G-like
MRAYRRSRTEPSNDSGVSIVIIAAGMVFVLAMAGLGIDLASLYVGRSQAQRAADAAALAGAQAFVDNTCATGDGGNISPLCVTLATQQAEGVGNQNKIAGVGPNIKDIDVSFPSYSTNDPQIQVTAGRGTYDGLDHGNAMPTFFMKIFGITTATVSATATAEAYNPSGTTGSPIGSKCVKPWMLPNCDSSWLNQNNPNCAGGTGPLVTSSGALARTPLKDYPAGPLGEPIVLKPGTPGTAPAPGQFFVVYIPNTTAIPTSCPACANGSTTSGGNGSGSLYRANIECCNQNPVVCGEYLQLNNNLQSSPGNMTGPSLAGTDCLIHQDTNSGSTSTSNCGQDFIQGTTDNCNDPSSGLAQDMPLLPSLPPNVMPGQNNPLDPGGSKPITYAASDSVIVVPIFDGVVQSGQNSVPVTGFAELFLRDVTTSGNAKGTVYAYVINVSGCPSGGGSGTGNPPSGGDVVLAGGSSVPVRLIHQ